jgi:hypothetical protein
VGLHRRLGDDEGLSDLGVRETPADERQDLQLARGQLGEFPPEGVVE